jgi:arylsulfatase A-like enzyme
MDSLSDVPQRPPLWRRFASSLSQHGRRFASSLSQGGRRFASSVSQGWRRLESRSGQKFWWRLAAFLLLQPNFWLLLVAQVGFYWHFTYVRIVVSYVAPWVAVLGAFSVVAMLGLVNLGLALLPWRSLRVFFNSLFILVHFLLILFHWRRGASLDFALLLTNLRELVSPSGFRAVFEVSGIAVASFLAGLVAWMILVEVLGQGLSRIRPCPRPRVVAPVLVALLLPCLGPWQIPNEITLFLRSAHRFVHNPAMAAIAHMDVPQRYPLFRIPEHPRPTVFSPQERPNVFVIMMESFSWDFVQQREVNGAEVTPFFNSLIAKGAYHKLFFANSMQTERGQIASLCSMVPSFRRKVMTDYKDNHFLCLPEIMRRAGYSTLWAQAHSDLGFDSVGDFMRKIGFEKTIAMDDKFVTKEDADYKWGWGLQDDRFFHKVFAYIDKEPREPGKPIFCTLATISNHMDFKAVPEKLRTIYPKPNNYRERFVNSIHLADSFLKTFFDELERRDHLRNSLVLLFGDHGYPTGQHDFTSNEVSYFNENFRVPLLVVGAKVEPFTNSRIAYSQLDIAPSLLEWLGLAQAAPFSGVPIPFRAADLPSTQHSIPLVQPYDGGFLMSLRYPYKYVRSLNLDDEWLFDLENDPHEDTNLRPSWGEQREPLPTLVRDLGSIYLNQRLLDEDRFVPGERKN